MTEPPLIHVACVGAGYFAGFHFESWARLPRAQVVGACDLDLARAQATGLPAFADLSEMLGELRPDLLDVIVPPEAQADVIKTALAYRVPTIICQKPFCVNLAEARRVAQSAEAAGGTLVVHENFRFQPWYRTIKHALENGRIGLFQNAMFRFRPGDGQGPQAYMERQPYFQKMSRFLVHETAVHWIDTFGYLFGDPVSVYADLRRLNPAIKGEDAGLVVFEYEAGARAIFDGNRHLDHAADNLRRTMGEALIEGTQGTLRLGGDGVVHHRAHRAQDETVLLGADSWGGFGGDCVHGFQSHVMTCLEEGRAPDTLAARYLRVLEIEEAIYVSAREGRKVRVRSS